MKATREVNAFRRVVEVLAAPGLFGALTEAGTSAMLLQPLPIADESPFAALPDDIEAREDGGEAGGATASRSAALAMDIPAAAPAKPLHAGPLAGDSARPVTAASAPASGSAPPVFSLRRPSRGRSVAGAEQAVRAVGDARSLRPSLAVESGDTDSSRPRTESRMEARELAARVGGPQSEAWIPAATATAAAGVAGMSAPREGDTRGPVDELSNALSEVGRLASVVMSSEAGAKASFASPSDAASRSLFLGPRSAGSSHAITFGSNPLQERQLMMPDGRAAESEQVSPVGAPANSSPVTTAAPIVHSNAVGMAAEPDPEWVAALVNEALAEQARRHGVDLS